MKKNENKCFLAKEISHKPGNKVDERLLEERVACYLHPKEFMGSGDVDGERDNKGHVSGMKSPTFICARCCLLISMLLDERAVLLRDGTITNELLAHDPMVLLEFLTPKSKDVAEALLKSGVNLAMVHQTCAQCNAQYYQQMLAEGQSRAWKGTREIDNELHTR